MRATVGRGARKWVLGLAEPGLKGKRFTFVLWDLQEVLGLGRREEFGQREESWAQSGKAWARLPLQPLTRLASSVGSLGARLGPPLRLPGEAQAPKLRPYVLLEL